MVQTGITFDARAKLHDTGIGHPEQPARWTAVINRLEWRGLMHDLIRLPSRSATDDDLALVHRREYIALVEREVSENRPHLSTGDVEICPESAMCARLSAGCVMSAVEAVMSGSVHNAFCVVRPPGHHASQDVGMGFCLFNNLAIGTRYAQRKFGAERIMIVDWDVHHGNGTQDIFYEDGSVLFFSTHQSPWYPGTGAMSERGEGAGEGKTINCPFPAGTGRKEIFGAVTERLMPVAREFRPDLVMISAGFDSRINDPLGNFCLTDQDFRDLTGMMMDFASQFCSGRLVSVLEGGYNLDGLALACESHIRALLGDI
jgi:acetoin utilization deacetylase AcuC-like enzyme